MKKCYEYERMCGEEGCRHFINWMETGNCVLRVDREHTLEEIGIAFGVTRERARQVVDTALNKFFKRMPVEMKEGRRCVQSSKPHLMKGKI